MAVSRFRRQVALSSAGECIGDDRNPASPGCLLEARKRLASPRS